YIAPRRRLWNYAYSHLCRNHAARRLEIADLYPKTQYAAQVVRRLQQECVNGAGFGEPNVVIDQGLIEINRCIRGQWMILVRDKRQAVGPIRQELTTLATADLGGNADIGRPVGDRLDNQVAEPFAQFDIDVGMRGKVVGQNCRHEFI